MITPPHELRKAVAPAADGDEDPVARAEAALAELSGEFAVWMDAECERLEAARQDVKRDGFSKVMHDALFRAAHDIKGHGTTFGYPMASDVADSLCRVMEHAGATAQVPLTFIDQCVDSVRAIIREHDDDNAEETAAELAKELRALTDELLGADGKADEATPASPPLAPA